MRSTPGTVRLGARAVGARAAFAAIALLAFAAPACWAGVALVSADREVVVEVHETAGAYWIHGVFTADVPLAVAWEVLADYERIGGFVKSVRTSAFVSGPGGTRVLRQDAMAGVFPFRRTVRVELALEEQRPLGIVFHDVLGRDFLRYTGAWALGVDAAGTTVDYTLDADPRAGIPALVGRGVMSRSARDLLTQVRSEMVRRAAAPAANAPVR